MANIVGTYYSNQNYNPKINYSVNYWQTARDANSVTYRFTVSYARQNGSYYYDVYINYSVGGKSGNVLLKANNDGTASTSCTFDVTCSTNAGGGTIYARIYSWSNTDSTHWQNGFDTGDKDVNKSTFNTAPYWGSGAVINLSPNGIVREDTSSVTVSWTGALDLETTSGMKYKVDRYINGNFSTTIANGTTLTSLVDNIGSGNSGNVYTYRVTPIDNYGVVGSTLTNSQSLTKNTLRGANITGNQSINNNTSSFSVNVSGGSNSMGTGNISRKLSSNNLTINNAYVGIGNITITIYKSGTVPTGAYILYEDIRALFKDATNQSGNFQITLSTYNEFGSSSQSTITANVDLRDVPNPPSNIKITGTKIVNGTSYYIPSIQNLTLTWNNGSDKVDGSTLKYEVQGSTSASSGWKTLASNIQSTSSTTSSTITISDGDFDGGRNYYFKVIGYNAFNLSSSAISSAIVLHKYSSPTVSFGIAKRTTTQLVVPITTTLNTSLPNITFNVSNSTEGLRKRNYSLKLKGTNTFVKPSTQITTSPQTITINGLEASKEYVLEVIVNDTSGLTANDIAKQLDIGKYIPIVSIRDKGLGINDFADDNYKLAVGGNAKIDGTLSVTGSLGQSAGACNDFNSCLAEGEYIVEKSSSINGAPYTGAIYGKLIVKVSDGGIHNNSNNCIWQIFYRNEQNRVYRRSKANSSNWSNWVMEYDTSNKPSPSDIGAAASSHDHNKIITSNNGGIYEGNGDAANSTQANVQIKSWFGIGFAPSISGQSVPQNQNAIWMNVRNGDIGLRGNLDARGNLFELGRRVVESGSSNSGRYVRYSDGTQICYGGKWFGTVTMTNQITTVYSNTGVGLNGILLTFAANFVHAPYCIANSTGSGYMVAHCSGSTTSSTVIRIWVPYATTADGIEAQYIAIGRWY